MLNLTYGEFRKNVSIDQRIAAAQAGARLGTIFKIVFEWDTGLVTSFSFKSNVHLLFQEADFQCH